MEETGIVGILLIIGNILVSYNGFKDRSFFRTHMFHVDAILYHKEYSRLLSSGFLHIGWVHLAFNMLSLHAFSKPLEDEISIAGFIAVYFGSLIAGSLLALYIHHNHGDYSAIGASGAVCGIVFAYVALFPGAKLSFLFLPLAIPNWLFAIAFLGISLYGIKSKLGNIGHEAHLGGAFAGMLIALALRPEAFAENRPIILLFALPILAFLLWIAYNPSALLIDNNPLDGKSIKGNPFKTNPFKGGTFKGNPLKSKSNKRSHLRVVRSTKEKQPADLTDIDAILDKISSKGISSLTPDEMKRLNDHSNQ